MPETIRNAYRASWYGRPGTAFVDLPADLIQGALEGTREERNLALVPESPKGAAEYARVFKIAQLIKSAKAPLIVIGKGAAYAQAEEVIRQLIEKTGLPFLPTPMGKGVVADSHPANAASARSTALKEADVVLVLGARLNWILHFGEAPKWNPHAKFIQVDISADEIGRNRGDASLGVVGDIGIVISQLLHALGSWHYDARSSVFSQHIFASKAKNEAIAAKKATENKNPMTYARVFNVIKTTLDSLSAPEDGGIVYISEGANTMDISRSIFTVSHPRLRLDAGTYATMGVGLGYAIAAHVAYNNGSFSSPDTISGPTRRKKIVAFEGDSAFGFSAMEIETMARYDMDVLVFVLNNGGVYHGDTDDADRWLAMQRKTVEGSRQGGLRSTSLGWEVGYETIATACGGLAFLVRTPEELERATREGFATRRVCVVNVIIEAGSGGKLEFGWQAGSKKGGKVEGASKL